MKFVRNLAILLLFLVAGQESARAAATLLPNGMQCFSATTGLNGMVGLLGAITGGTGGTAGTYGGVALTGGAGTGATANITVAGGVVTAVAVLNPGVNYVVGDVLSAVSATIGNVTGFSVPVASISINSSLAGGTVAFYYPNTSTFKQTWFNADQALTHQNTNPVQLDANGCAVIYGIGSYRQVVKDSLGNTVWDQLTTDTSANNNIFWAGTAGGTPNVITVVDPGFNATDGSVIQFVPLSSNTGPATLNPSGFGAIPIVKGSSSGTVALSAGDLVAGYIAYVVYSASTNAFQLLNPAPSGGGSSASAAIPSPQGYLTLSSDPNAPVLAGDAIGNGTVFYSPFVGNQVPIYNGVSFVSFTFPQLVLTLTGSHLANTIYDVCVFSNAGSPSLVTSPAWSSSAAGSSTRGTGAGSPQLQSIQGFLVNAVAITGTNGPSTFSVPVNQCTYLGSIFIDSSSGQISAYRSYGQSRKFGVWNAYNKQRIVLQMGDPTASWTYGTATIRQSNANTANTLTTFTGLAEDPVRIKFSQQLQHVSTGNTTSEPISIGIGLNSTTGYSGKTSVMDLRGFSNSPWTASLPAAASHVLPPGLGINNINTLELGDAVGTVTFFGTNGGMLLTAEWNG